MPNRDKWGYQPIDSIKVVTDASQKKYLIEICAGKQKHQLGAHVTLIPYLNSHIKENVEEIDENFVFVDDDPNEKIFYSPYDRVWDVHASTFSNFIIQGTSIGLSPNCR